MILAIDFDGTIVKDQFPDIGEMVEGAKEVINKLKYEGYIIIIWTCRTGVELTRAIDWLVMSGIKFDQINQSCPNNPIKYGGRDTRKIYADLYIDDKGLMKPLPTWDELYWHVHDRVPTYGDKVARDGFL